MPSGIYNHYKLTNEKNGMWKGELAGYVAKHMWIQRVLGKPTQCQECKKNGLKNKKIHWANLSGKYKRDIGDWIRLCAKCHFKLDKDRHIPWNKGKICPQISAFLKGKKLSLTTKRKLRLAHLGKVPWNRGLKYVIINGKANFNEIAKHK